MPNARAAGPAARPVAGKRVSGKSPKKSPAKKAARKRVAKKSAKPKFPRTLKQKAAAKRAAAVVKRKRTRSATNVMVGAEPVAVDPHDEVAVTKIARRQVRGRTAVDRQNDPPPAAGI